MMRISIGRCIDARTITTCRASVLTDALAAENLGDLAKVLNRVRCWSRGYHEVDPIISKYEEIIITLHCKDCEQEKRISIEEFLEGEAFIWR